MSYFSSAEEALSGREVIGEDMDQPGVLESLSSSQALPYQASPTAGGPPHCKGARLLISDICTAL
jgi:hypothetical protein